MRRCSATVKATGEQCKAWAVRGASVCNKHGASAPQVKAAAQRRLAEGQARKLTEHFGLVVDVAPAEALRSELSRAAGMVCWLTLQCDELAAKGELVWGTERRVVKTNPGQGAQSSVPQVEVTWSSRPHPYLAMLERERRHLAHVAVEMEKLGLEARQVRVIEAQALQLARVIKAILGDLGLTPEQQALVGEVVPARLRELGADRGPPAQSNTSAY